MSESEQMVKIEISKDVYEDLQYYIRHFALNKEDETSSHAIRMLIHSYQHGGR
jgi:hypothetical protein